MERLWAPWRMTYIDQVNAGGEPPSCIFCQAASSDQDLVVHRSPGAVALLNRYPYNPGHLMVAPLGHVADISELDPEQLRAVVGELQLATSVLRRELDCDGFNGGWNQGRIAGAGIDSHIHFHLVPRWSGDTNFMPVLADVRVIPEHLEATARKLRLAFQEADPQAG